MYTKIRVSIEKYSQTKNERRETYYLKETNENIKTVKISRPPSIASPRYTSSHDKSSHNRWPRFTPPQLSGSLSTFMSSWSSWTPISARSPGPKCGPCTKPWDGQMRVEKSGGVRRGDEKSYKACRRLLRQCTPQPQKAPKKNIYTEGLGPLKNTIVSCQPQRPPSWRSW